MGNSTGFWKRMIVAGGLAFGAPLVAFAIGQVSEQINVPNARRGQVIEEKLTLQNKGQGAKDETYQLTAEGDITGWATFYLPSDPQTEVTEVPIPAGANVDAIVRLKVPDDAANGTYTGTIVMSVAPPKQESETETIVTVGLQSSRPVSITVTDEEDIKAEVSVIPERYDIKPGEPLKVRVVFRNEGNVQITPQVQAKVRVAEINGQVMVDTIFPYPDSIAPVKPRESGEVTYTIATNSLAEGKYRTEVIATFRETELGRHEFAITVNPKAAEGFAGGAASGAGRQWLLWAAAAAVVVAVAAVMMKRKKT